MSSSGGSSRQRNCNACVRSKRRCDKGQPACGRCVKQRYPCVYGGRRRLDMAVGDSADVAFGLDYLADPASNSGTFGTTIDLLAGSTFHLNDDFSSLLAPIPGNNGLVPDSWPSQFTETSSMPCGHSLVRKDYSKMAPMCSDYAPWQLSDPSTKAAFTINLLTKLHIKFANNRCTLYIHPYLYKDNMPRCMLQAFTMCLLYTNHTESNRGIVLRVLHESVTELKTIAASKTLVPQEKLGRVHAMMFYQLIRMFDGDVTLGQQVDDDMALLESWNNDLCKVRDNLDDFTDKGMVVSEHSPESWERWIFAESLRRTCIMCICIQKVWGMLKMRLRAVDIGDWGSSSYRWTLSRKITLHSYLWNAQNSFDFFRAWKEKPLYIISTFNFEEFLKCGTGDDLDDFAFYFLTLYFGVNEIKTFCHETSGHVLTLM